MSGPFQKTSLPLKMRSSWPVRETRSTLSYPVQPPERQTHLGRNQRTGLQGGWHLRGFIGIARDITDRVKMEEELHRQHILLERELEVATRVHETLIPKNLKTDQLDLALTYRPVSSMGGDYASYFLHDNRLLFIISDVTGHGVPAALLVNRVDSEFKRQASKNKEPGDIMKTLESFIEHQFRGTQMYLSAFCGALEFGSGRLAYSNYGHLPQIVFNPEENKIDLMEAQTTLLNFVNRGEAPIQDEITLSPQARIFYSQTA